MATLRDLSKKAQELLNSFQRDLRNNPSVVRTAQEFSRAGSRANSKFIGDYASNFGVGLGSRGIDVAQNTVNSLANLGSRVTGLQNPQLNLQPLKTTLYPELRRPDMSPQAQFGRGAGGFAFNQAQLMANAGGISKAPAIKGLQNRLDNFATRQLANPSLPTKYLGRGVANLSEGLPFTAASAGQNFVEGRDVSKGLAQDLLFDTITGPLFMRGTRGAKNVGKAATDKELLEQILKDESGTFAGKSAASLQGLSPEQLKKELIKKRAYSNVKDKGLRFFLSDKQANLKRGGLKEATNRGFGTLDEILDHPKLFKEYPQARSITVQFDPNMGAKGSYNEASNVIRLNPNNINFEQLGTILHENQHFIQGLEGFSKGTNLRDVNFNTEGYLKNQGEAEARTVQNNLGVTQNAGKGRDLLSEQLQKEGIKPEELIVRGGRGAESLDIGTNKGNILDDAKKVIKTSDEVSKKPLRENLDTFYTQWVNRFHPIDSLVKDIEKKYDVSLLPSKNPSLSITRLLGSGGKAELRHKQKLMPILDSIPDTVEKGDFDVFLKAKRDLDLGGRDIKGSDVEQARGVINALVEKYGDVEAMNEAATKLYSYQDDNLKSLRDAGFIDDKTLETIKDTNKNYVPFQRVMDELDEYLGVPSSKLQQSTNPLQKIKGSDRPILSPLESIVANTYKTEAAVSKNKAAQDIVNLRKVNPELEGLFTRVSKSGSNTLSVWEDGKKVFYEAPEDIVKAVKGLDEEQANIVTRIASAPARLLRQGATGRNIDFMIPNVFKDQFDAAIGAKYGYTPFVDYFRGLAHLINYKRTGSDELIEDWINNGGQIFFENMGGRKAVAEQIKEQTTKGNKRVIRKLGEWAIGGIDTIGEFSEVPTRLGVYNKARKATGNSLIAAREAREATVDFARMGSKMKTANSLVPFLNVGVQGFDKLIRTAKDDPKSFAMRMTMYGLAPALTLAAYNNTYHKEEYSEIPSWEKDSNFVVVTGRDEKGRATYLKFPKGNVLPYITNPVDQFVSYLADSSDRDFKAFALNFLGDSLPVVEGGDTLQEAGSRTLGANTPQIMKPALQAVANYDFFRARPIVGQYEQNKPKSEQYRDNTPGIYKQLGLVANQSPLKLQNFAESTLGTGYSKMPLNTLETIQNVQEGKSVDTNKVPILRRFTGVGGTPDEVAVRQAYAEKDKLKQEVEKAQVGGFFERLQKALSRTGKASSTFDVKDDNVMKVLRPSIKDHFEKGTALPDVFKDYDEVTLAALGYNATKYLDREPTDKLEKRRFEQSLLKDARRIFKEESLPADIKKKLLKAHGYSMDEIELDIVSNQPVIDKTIWVRDRLKTIDNREQMLGELESLRRPVNGKTLLSEGVIDNLVEEGIIQEEEAKELKALKIDDKGELKKKAKTSKKKAGVKVSAPKIRALKLASLGKSNFKPTKVRIKKAPTIKVKASSSPKLKFQSKKYAPVKVKGFVNTLDRKNKLR